LFRAQASTGPSAAVLTSEGQERDEVAVQLDISATASVAVEARLGDNLPWVVLETLTQSGLKVYGRLPQFRLNIVATTGQVSGSVGY
jgi:hypothetical protein